MDETAGTWRGGVVATRARWRWRRRSGGGGREASAATPQRGRERDGWEVFRHKYDTNQRLRPNNKPQVTTRLQHVKTSSY
jgi:hypothetical protein